MKKIGLLINPHAKQTRRNPRLINKILTLFPVTDHIWMPKTVEELSVVTKNILDQKIEILFLSGGDGTFRATVHAFLSHGSEQPLPFFVLLQGGTGGLYSKRYFGKKRADVHMSEVLAKLAENPELVTTPVNVLKVNDYYGFIFDVGGFSNLLRYYMGHKERSLALANWLLVRMTFSFFFGTPFYKKLFPQFSIRVKDSEKPERNLEITSLSCSTLPIGYVISPFYQVKMNEFFSAMIFFKSPYLIYLHLLSVFQRKEIQNRDMEIFASHSLELFLPHPLQPMVDGDILESTQNITIQLGPEIHLLTL